MVVDPREMDFWNGKKKSFEILHYWERLMTLKYMIWAWDGICCNLPQIQKNAQMKKTIQKRKWNWDSICFIFMNILFPFYI